MSVNDVKRKNSSGDDGIGASTSVDAPFRFAVEFNGAAGDVELEEYYRGSIRDLLAVVRFYAKGKPVIVDSFAFRNNLRARFAILSDKGK